MGGWTGLVLGLGALVLVTLLATVAEPAGAVGVGFGFAYNVTEPEVECAAVGDDGVVYVLHSDLSLAAMDMTGGGLNILWSSPPIGSGDGCVALATNSTSGGKLLVAVYRRGVDNVVLRVMDAASGRGVLPDLTLPADYTATVTLPRVLPGDRIVAAVLGYGSSDSDLVVEYYTNGTSAIYDLGALDADSPTTAGFSPNATFFAAKLDNNAIVVYDLKGNGWVDNNITISLPQGSPRLVRWLNDTLILVETGATVSYSDNEYDLALLIDVSGFPAYTVKSVLLNMTGVYTRDFWPAHVDGEGNLVAAVSFTSSSSSSLAGVASLWVFNPSDVTWVNSTLGLATAYPTPLWDLASDWISYLWLGEGYAYYLHGDAQPLHVLQAYTIAVREEGSQASLGEKSMFVRSIERTSYFALTLSGDGRLYLGVASEDSMHASATLVGEVNLTSRLFRVYQAITPRGDLAFHLTAMALSPDGARLAVGGVFENSNPLRSGAGAEESVIMVFDTGTGELVFNTSITYPNSLLDWSSPNIFVSSLQFLDPSLLLVGVEYYDYTLSPGTLVKSILVYSTDGNRLLYNRTLTESFLPGDLEAKSLMAVGYIDPGEQGIIVYALSTSQELGDSGPVQLARVYKMTFISSAPEGTLVQYTIINRTGEDYRGLMVTGLELTGDHTHLVSTIVEKREPILGGWPTSMPASYLLKIRVQGGLFTVTTLNLTDQLVDKYALEYYDRVEIAGVTAGLKVVGDMPIVYIERHLSGIPDYNLLVADADLAPVWNLSLTVAEGGEVSNYGLSFSSHAPTNGHIAVSPEGDTIIMVSKKGLHMLVGSLGAGGGETTSPPPEAGGESGGEETTTQPPTTPPVGLSPERLEVAKKTLETLHEIADVTRTLENLTLPAELTLDIANASQVKTLLEEAGVKEAMDKLVERGLVKPPQGKLRGDHRASLVETLERLYGPMLRDYPTTVGRIYLLYTLYYTEEG